MKQPSIKQAFMRMHADHAFVLQSFRNGCHPHARQFPVSRKVKDTLRSWGCFEGEGLSGIGRLLLQAWERQEEASKARRSLPLCQQKRNIWEYCHANGIQLV